MNDLETRQEYELTHGTAKYWQIELELADTEERDWRKAGDKVVERYRGDDTNTMEGREKRFNILWSNTETLKGSLFARMAKPDIRRRYLDRDPQGRQVAMVLERALEYSSDIYDEAVCVEAALEDYLLPGRGTVWVEYEPVIVEQEVIDLNIETGEPETQIIEEIGEQKCKFKYVHWKDYRESPAKRPEDVRWKARRHLKTRQELIDEFDGGEDIPLNWSPTEDDKDLEDAFKRAEVWEIWDKVEAKRVYVVKGYPELLKEEDDPYGLEGFFPTPDALVSVRTNETGVPVPEFTLYEDQADELDRVTTRINRLVDALKRRGLYDAAIPELAKMANAKDNEFIPSENYSNLVQGGGLQASMQAEDLTPAIQAISTLYQQRDQLVQTIYEVTGISDVIRGSTDPNETATAQKLKGQFGSMRMKKRQDQLQRYIKNLFRIKAEIIAEHYEPHILQQMTGLEVTPDMIQIMRSDKLRSYRIDIETDSTVFEDAEGEKKSRIEFVNTLGAFLEKALPVVQAAPELTSMTFEAMEFMVRGHKIGRQFEDVLEETKQNVIEGQKQAQNQPPQPDPAMVEAQQAREVEAARMQADQAQAQADTQLKAQQASDAAALNAEKMRLDAERIEIERLKAADATEKWREEARLKERELDLKEREIAISASEKDARIRLDAVKTDYEREAREDAQRQATD